ncbi:PepSY domain-containing protein [Clostridium sp. AL.422]|uniref:PepSY domain-containing protein n=1 Tax=Clostridium TaxID=1485 RepID=UPI00293DB336|nr:MULTISPECIES: PepSY domain-containing protein [unclassified Clostridium]MDV4150753.1 PepSY domain-containing protein [Clostridium sp. AL.422]
MKKLAVATMIISISMSLAGCGNSAVTYNNKNITVEEAKEIALKHANLASDQVSFIRTETDMENGVQKYDIEFYYENKEYDYEVNATNGQIIGYDYDVENYNIPTKEESNNVVNNQPSNSEESTQTSNNTNENQQSNNTAGNQQSNSGATLITVEEAKQIALNHAGLSSSQVTLVKSELDFDDGIQKYELEFYFNNKEYNYEIDANTGNILKYEID